MIENITAAIDPKQIPEIITKPIEWVHFVLPHQIFRIGQIFILDVPGEFRTMSGRRLKLTIQTYSCCLSTKLLRFSNEII